MSDVFYIDRESNLSLSEMVQQVLVAIGGLEKFIHPGALVVIKPNFVAPFPQATTSLEMLEAIIKEVRNCQGTPIIAESSGFEFETEATFRVLGVYEFAERNNVELRNLDKGRFIKVQFHSHFIDEVEIAEIAQQADVIINVPKLKRHNLTKVTIGVKNMFGLLSLPSRRKIHALGLERGIFELSQCITSDFVIVDGTTVGSRAVYGEFQELGAVIGGTDAYAVDLFSCQFLHTDYRTVGYLEIALEKGIAKDDFTVMNLARKDDKKVAVSPFLARSDSLKKKIHRFVYQLVYLADMLYSRLFNTSIIPTLHFYFGMRPFLDKKRCTDCGKCVPICPVNAIQIPQRLIDAELCMPVRCMHCVPVCPENAIRIKGREVPLNFGSGYEKNTE